MRFFTWLFTGIFSRNKNPIEQPIIAKFLPFRTAVTIERYTIRHMCAVDSLMTIIETIRDFDTFCDMGDLELYVDYCLRIKANKKAIDKEESEPFKY